MATLLVPEVLTSDPGEVVPYDNQTIRTNVLDWGVALHRADLRAQASGANLVIVPPGPYNVASSVTITSNVLFQAGAQLSINSGKTVTFNGAVDGPQTQIFAGAGTATLANASQTITPGVWTGGTGVTLAGTTTASLGAASTAGGVILPNAIYVHTGTVINASATTTYSLGFTVPNDGPTWKVAAVSYRYHVAGPAALTFQITADASATAVGAGTNQLQSGADLHGVVADTVANGTVLASPTTLAAGASLGLVISSATQTGLAALQVTVALQRVS